MKEPKVIHIREVLQTMNRALRNHEQVSFRAWKVGKSASDPERGELKTYDHVYITSHSKTGNYKILDPLAESEDMKRRNVCEALISEFMNKKVIW